MITAIDPLERMRETQSHLNRNSTIVGAVAARARGEAALAGV
jgi:hypothetical protein